MNKILSLLIGSLFVVNVFSQTTITGTIINNTNWTIANSPYIINSEVIVLGTLTISPGVIVQLSSTGQLHIKSSGNLIINGTITDSVTFTSSNVGTEKPGDWNQIMLDGCSNASSINYARILFGENGLYIYNANATIKNSNISNNSNYGVYLYGTSNTSKIDSCYITNNVTGVYASWAGWGNEIIVSNSIISGNSNSGFFNNSAAMSEHNCIIKDNTAYGIYFDGVGQSTITGNTLSGSGTAIYSTSGNVTISKNTIQNNNKGVEVGIYPIRTIINCNKFSNNSLYNLSYIGGVQDGIVDARFNYFATTDSSQIASTVNDVFSNSKLAGSFNVSSYLYTDVLAVITNPNDTNICVNTDLKLIAKANEPNATYTWYKDGKQLIESSSVIGTTNATLTIPSISPSNNGKYYCIMSTHCSTVTSNTATVSVINPPLSISISGSTAVCDNVGISLKAEGTFNTFEWSQGSSDQELAILNDGSYAVSAIDNNGCVVTADTMIHLDRFSVQKQNNKSIVCGGQGQFDIPITNYKGTDELQYSWAPAKGLNDSTIAQPKFTITDNASYTLTVIAPNGCTDIQTIAVDVTPLTVTVAGLILTCGTDSHFKVSTNYSGNDILQYKWTPNAGLDNDTVESPLVHVTEPTDYSLELSTPNGCVAKYTTQVRNTVVPVVPAICKVTIDNNKDVVQWQKDQNTALDSLYIYRESSIHTGSYDKIGQLKYSGNSLFIDTTSNGSVQSNNYKISFKDICGLETATSDSRNSMYVTVAKGSGGGFDLKWLPYSVNDVDYYEIYRGSSKDNLSYLTGVTSSTTSWSDNSAPKCVLYYQIHAVLKTAGENNNQVTSNSADNGVEPAIVSINGNNQICAGQASTLDAGNFSTYLWSSGQTTQTINASEQGIYTVSVTNAGGCPGSSEPFTLHVNELPNINLGSDTVLCGNGFYKIMGPTGYESYLWDNGSTQTDRTVSSNGLYKVTVTDNKGCQNSDDVLVSYVNKPELNIDPLFSICGGTSVTIDPGVFPRYKWSDNSTERIHAFEQAGMYSVSVTDGNNCTNNASFEIQITRTAHVDLGADTILCDNGTLQLKTSQGFASYLWNDGSTNTSLTVTKPGIYFVMAKDIFNCSNTDTIEVKMASPITPLQLEKNITSCQHNIVSIHAGNSYSSYKWNTGSTDSILSVTSSGIYTVTVTNKNGCSTSDTTNVTFLSPYTEELACVSYSVDNGNNVVIAWQRTEKKRTAMYKVYRETGSLNDFSILIGQRHYNDLPYVVDSSVDLSVQTHRYRLTTIDSTCGDSSFSTPHKTIHVNTSRSLENYNDLLWNSYEGVPLKSYYIYKFASDGKKSLVDSISNTDDIITYTDKTEPQENVHYQIAYRLPKIIDLQKLKSDTGPFSQSLSNLAESELTKSSILSTSDVSISPNPAQDYVIIHTLEAATVELYSLNSELLLKTPISETQTIALDAFVSGFYIVKINTIKGVVIKKLLIEKK